MRACLHQFLAGLLHELHLALVRVEVWMLDDTSLMCAVDLVCEHIQEHLRVRGRSQHTIEEGRRRLQLGAESGRVGEVAIVDEEHAKRRVDEEGLRLLC